MSLHHLQVSDRAGTSLAADSGRLTVSRPSAHSLEQAFSDALVSKRASANFGLDGSSCHLTSHRDSGTEQLEPVQLCGSSAQVPAILPDTAIRNASIPTARVALQLLQQMHRFAATVHAEAFKLQGLSYKCGCHEDAQRSSGPRCPDL